MILRPATHRDILWLSELLPFSFTKNCSGIVAEENEDTLGMIALDYWTPRSVQAHIAIINARALVPLRTEVLDYLWKNGRRLLYAVTPSDNEKSLALQKALGFTEQYRLKNGWDDGIDMVITELAIHGKERTETA